MHNEPNERIPLHLVWPVSDLLEDLRGHLQASYRIDEELGGGGMSRVFIAEEVSLGRRVVLKVLPPDLTHVLSAERFGRWWDGVPR